MNRSWNFEGNFQLMKSFWCKTAGQTRRQFSNRELDFFILFFKIWEHEGKWVLFSLPCGRQGYRTRESLPPGGSGHPVWSPVTCGPCPAMKRIDRIQHRSQCTSRLRDALPREHHPPEFPVSACVVSGRGEACLQAWEKTVTHFEDYEQWKIKYLF